MVKNHLHAISARPTILDYSIIESGIKAASQSDRTRGSNFARYVLHSHFNIALDQVDSFIVDGGQDRGIDLVFIDHEASIINIGSCKCVSSFKKAQTNFPGDEIDKIISFLNDLLLRNDGMLLHANGALASKVREIWDLIETSSSTFRIVVHLFSNQLTLAASEELRLSVFLAGKQIRLLQHGLYELAHGVIRSKKPKFQKRLRPIHNSYYDFKEKDHRGWSLRVDLSALFEFLAVGPGGPFDERITLPNVRYFLGLDTAINDRIRTELMNGDLSEFWFLNNGITIACDQIIDHGSANLSLRLVNPRIVNGAQTANVLFEVGSHKLADLSSGAVSIKLIETKDEAFVERISLAANTQNRIFGRDLKAFDNLQEKLELGLSQLGYRYIRKRGDSATKDNAETIDMMRAGQLMLSFVSADPTKCKTQTNDIFDGLYEKAFPRNLIKPALIVAAHKTYKCLEDLRQEAISWQRTASKNSFSETWLIEGHFHVLFVIGELMRREGTELTEDRRAIALIPKAMEVVSRFVDRNPGSAAYRLFRLEITRDKLLDELDNMDGSVRQLTFDFVI